MKVGFYYWWRHAQIIIILLSLYKVAKLTVHCFAMDSKMSLSLQKERSLWEKSNFTLQNTFMSPWGWQKKRLWSYEFLFNAVPTFNISLYFVLVNMRMLTHQAKRLGEINTYAKHYYDTTIVIVSMLRTGMSASTSKPSLIVRSERFPCRCLPGLTSTHHQPGRFYLDKFMSVTGLVVLF